MLIATKQLPHLLRLVEDYFYDHDKVADFFNGNFREIDAFQRQAERVQSRPIPREEVAAVLTEQNKSYGCGPETIGHIEKIIRDRACAVVTGQQVGLFSGPLYTIYKALTAIKLAERLNRQRLGSFVPVFWLASEDHDLAEIDHIALVDKDNRPEEVRCPMPPLEGRVPASNLLLPPDILGCLEQLKSLTRDSEFKTDIVGNLSEAYQPGRSFVEAFARWMTHLFKRQGLIFIDASHPRLKELGSGVFYQEIADESPSTRQAITASQKLRHAGYDVQVPLHEGILNIFYADRERRSIRWKDGAFGIKGLPAPSRKEELLAWARQKPFLFSPNVLLRPVYQDALLPTVAYIGGPGEIAYFAQMKGVYEAFRLPMPVIYPRKSVTVVEKKIDHILKKYGLKIPDLWRGPAGLIKDISKEHIPESLDSALRLILDHVERDFESLEREVLGFDPTLKASVDLAKGKMIRQLKFMEKKTRQAARKQNETATQQLHKAVANLYPSQQLQERVFNIVPFLIKYGYAFIEKLGREIDIDELDHQVLFI
ncbi:MAG: bacillithiol biosynthesis cysteine-adding enzyme BshC [Candidatus Aminicenantales bacterium]